MIGPESRSNTYRDSGVNVMDSYLDIYARGPEYCAALAKYIFDNLEPDDRQTVQNTARELSAGNLALSAEISQSLLIFNYVNEGTPASAFGGAF